MFPVQLSRDEYCIHTVNYTVVLNDSVSNVTVEQVEVGSDSCEDGICSTSISPTPSNQTYRVSVIATNILGSSSPALSNNIICRFRTNKIIKITTISMTDGSIEFLYDHLLTFEDCVTTAFCSTTLSEMGNCTIQYCRDPSYQELGPPMSGPLNSSFPLPLMESSTLYYIQITFMLNSEAFILQRNYTSENGQY